jgi:hypothetical protein
LTLDLSGSALEDSVRKIQSIEVWYNRYNPDIDLIFNVKPEAFRQQVLHAYTKSVSAIWLVNTPIICVCFVAGPSEMLSNNRFQLRELFSAFPERVQLEAQNNSCREQNDGGSG